MKKSFLLVIIFSFLISCVTNTSDNKGGEENRNEVKTSLDSTADTMNAEAYIDRARRSLANEQISSAMRDINSALSLYS